MHEYSREQYSFPIKKSVQIVKRIRTRFKERIENDRDDINVLIAKRFKLNIKEVEQWDTNRLLYYIDYSKIADVKMEEFCNLIYDRMLELNLINTILE